MGAAKPIRDGEGGYTVYSCKNSAADFADCLIEAHNRSLGCRATATFDGRALQLAGFLSV
jgi:predicted nucleic-acid-binding protein